MKAQAEIERQLSEMEKVKESAQDVQNKMGKRVSLGLVNEYFFLAGYVGALEWVLQKAADKEKEM